MAALGHAGQKHSSLVWHWSVGLTVGNFNWLWYPKLLGVQGEGKIENRTSSGSLTAKCVDTGREGADCDDAQSQIVWQYSLSSLAC